MSLIQIPVADNPDQQFTVILESVAYDIRLQWNNRDEAWYIGMGRQNNTLTFFTKLTTLSDILRYYRAYETVPKGLLICLDLLKGFGRITRDGFSSGRWGLYYVTSDEIETYNQSVVDAIDREGIFRVDNDNRFISVPTPNYGIPFDGVFTNS